MVWTAPSRRAPENRHRRRPHKTRACADACFRHADRSVSQSHCADSRSKPRDHFIIVPFGAVGFGTVMTNQDEIREILGRDPENFAALHALAMEFRQNHSYAACFAMADRAIASYEAHPVAGEQNHFFELKRLHAQMLREHMPDLIGPAASMLDPRRKPIFKLGRPRELALCAGTHHLSVLAEALCANQLKRLRYLSITVAGNATQTLLALKFGRYDTLRALSLTFESQPDGEALRDFFETLRPHFAGIVSFRLHMPSIGDEIALFARRAFGKLEYLSFESGERLMTQALCEHLADDPQSESLMRLEIIGSRIGDNGLFALLSSECMGSVQAMDLRDGILTNNAARVVVAAHSLPQLRALDLRFNEIDPAGIDMLGQSPIRCRTEGQHTRPASAR